MPVSEGLMPLRVPEYVARLVPYVPGKPIEETEREYGVSGAVKLASNENPLGPSPKALQAIRAAGDVHLYPDGSSHHLTNDLARRLGVRPDQLCLGSGSNELIELIIRTFTLPEDEVLLCRGSFLMYRVSVEAHGRRPVEVPMAPGFRYDLQAMALAATSRTRLTFLANPDNPTGTAFSLAELQAFLQQVPPSLLVVLDEAYFEYVEWGEYPDGVKLLPSYPNLIVLRTFSKAYGLAGVRLGYGVMEAGATGYLHRTRMPFNVSALAQAAGRAALEDDAHVAASRALARAEVRLLASELSAMGLRVPESHANFVFAELGRPAQPVFEALLSRGVITRPLAAAGHPTALRITAGTREQNLRLVAALREVLS